MSDETTLGDLETVLVAAGIKEIRVRKVGASWEATAQARGVWWFGFTLPEAIDAALKAVGAVGVEP